MNNDKYWLIDRFDHNKAIQPGKIYRVPYDYIWDGEPDWLSPFRGLEVFVMEIFPEYTQAGYDCFVKLNCSASELAARYTVANGSETTASEVIDWHGEQNLHTDGYKYPPGLYIEHDTKFLELVFPE
jgi:hypothetical protein